MDDESRRGKGLLKAEDRSGRRVEVFQDEDGGGLGQLESSQVMLEDGWGDEESGRGKLIGVGLVVALCVGVASYFIVMSVIKTKEGVVAEVKVDVVESNFMDRADPEEVKKATEAAIQGFMNAASHEERCQFILNGDEMLPRLEEFYAREEAAFLPRGFGRVQSSEPAAFDGRVLMLALAVERSGKRAWAYSLFPVDDGMRIDWETSVSYGEMNWNRFRAEKLETPKQMRVYLKRSPGFQATQLSPDDFDTFEVSAFGVPGTETLYVLKGASVAEMLDRFMPSAGKHPVNLSLYWESKEGDDGNGERILRVEKVIHDLWTSPSGDLGKKEPDGK